MLLAKARPPSKIPAGGRAILALTLREDGAFGQFPMEHIDTAPNKSHVSSESPSTDVLTTRPPIVSGKRHLRGFGLFTTRGVGRQRMGGTHPSRVNSLSASLVSTNLMDRGDSSHGSGREHAALPWEVRDPRNSGRASQMPDRRSHAQAIKLHRD